MNTVILAEDEASIYLQASDKYVWAPRGQTPIVRVNTNRDCTHIYGSLNLITGKETVMRSQIMNSETTALYLNVLLHTYPDQSILLLWDRGSHCKSQCKRGPFTSQNGTHLSGREKKQQPEMGPPEHKGEANNSQIGTHLLKTNLVRGGGILMRPARRGANGMPVF